MHERKTLEKALEFLLFNSRWILAPFYLGWCCRWCCCWRRSSAKSCT